jgi:hypothetical protein
VNIQEANGGYISTGIKEILNEPKGFETVSRAQDLVHKTIDQSDYVLIKQENEGGNSAIMGFLKHWWEHICRRARDTRCYEDHQRDINGWLHDD